MLCLDKEIPHGTAVEITKFSQRDDDVIELDATIYSEKSSSSFFTVSILLTTSTAGTPSS